MVNHKWLKTIVFALAMYWPWSVIAHPHDWIDVTSTFVINDAAELVQINQRWRFDVYFSMMTYADLMNEHGDETVGLQRYADQMVKNLADYGYFSHLTISGSQYPFIHPSDYQLLMDTNTDPMIMVLDMSFDIALTAPVVNQTIEWQVFDPTFYVAMIQENESSINVVSNAALNCEKKFLTPQPSDDLITYAQSLNKEQTDSQGLGINFADRTVIYCDYY